MGCGGGWFLFPYMRALRQPLRPTKTKVGPEVMQKPNESGTDERDEEHAPVRMCRA